MLLNSPAIVAYPANRTVAFAPHIANDRKKSITLMATMAVRTSIVLVAFTDFFLSLAIWGSTTTVRVSG